MGERATVLALVEDLWFVSRIRAAAAGAGASVSTVRDAVTIVERAAALMPALVVVDMQIIGQDWEAAVQALKSTPATARLPVLAFGPHVDAISQATARSIGVDRVLSNQRFTETLPALLAQYVRAATLDQPG